MSLQIHHWLISVGFLGKICICYKQKGQDKYNAMICCLPNVWDMHE